MVKYLKSEDKYLRKLPLEDLLDEAKHPKLKDTIDLLKRNILDEIKITRKNKSGKVEKTTGVERKAIILMGSYGTNQTNETSDIDIMLAIDNDFLEYRTNNDDINNARDIVIKVNEICLDVNNKDYAQEEYVTALVEKGFSGEEAANYLKRQNKHDIKIWPVPIEWYDNNGKNFRSGLPDCIWDEYKKQYSAYLASLKSLENIEEFNDEAPEYFVAKNQEAENNKSSEERIFSWTPWDLDGWKGIANKIQLFEQKRTGRTLYYEQNDEVLTGKVETEILKKYDILENIDIKEIPPEEGYELFLIATRYLADGLFPDIISELAGKENIKEKIAEYEFKRKKNVGKAILRGCQGLLYLMGIKKPILLSDVPDLFSKFFINSQQKGFIKRAYANKKNPDNNNLPYGRLKIQHGAKKVSYQKNNEYNFLWDFFLFMRDISKQTISANNIFINKELDKRLKNYCRKTTLGLYDKFSSFEKLGISEPKDFAYLFIDEAIDLMEGEGILGDLSSLLSEESNVYSYTKKLLERVARFLQQEMEEREKQAKKEKSIDLERQYSDCLTVGKIYFELESETKSKAESFFKKAEKYLMQQKGPKKCKSEKADKESEKEEFTLSYWGSEHNIKLAEINYWLGKVYYNKNKRKSIKHLKKAIKLNPLHAETWDYLGKINTDGEESKYDIFQVTSELLKNKELKKLCLYPFEDKEKDTVFDFVYDHILENTNLNLKFHKHELKSNLKKWNSYIKDKEIDTKEFHARTVLHEFKDKIFSALIEADKELLWNITSVKNNPIEKFSVVDLYTKYNKQKLAFKDLENAVKSAILKINSTTKRDLKIDFRAASYIEDVDKLKEVFGLIN